MPKFLGMVLALMLVAACGQNNRQTQPEAPSRTQIRTDMQEVVEGAIGPLRTDIEGLDTRVTRLEEGSRRAVPATASVRREEPVTVRHVYVEHRYVQHDGCCYVVRPEPCCTPVYESYVENPHEPPPGF